MVKINAVVEGCGYDNTNPHYKAVELHIPETATIIESSGEKYRLHNNQTNSALEINLEDLGIMPGFLFPRRMQTALDSMVGRPRAIFLVDGRVFIWEDIFDDYVLVLDKFRGIIKRVFDYYNTEKINCRL